MKILGIDPGYDRVGWAVGNLQNQKLELLEFGCIQTSSKQDIFQRYQQIIAEIDQIITKHQPQQLAIEKLFFARNVNTALPVSEARGIIIGAALTAGLQVFEYSPSEVKSVVTGNGRSDKTAMAKMVKLQLKLSATNLKDDTLDAMGLLITHQFSHR